VAAEEGRTSDAQPSDAQPHKCKTEVDECLPSHKCEHLSNQISLPASSGGRDLSILGEIKCMVRD
jgi:hypothetical protein